jgi:hypothetical protein
MNGDEMDRKRLLLIDLKIVMRTLYNWEKTPPSINDVNRLREYIWSSGSLASFPAMLLDSSLDGKVKKYLVTLLLCTDKLLLWETNMASQTDFNKLRLYIEKEADVCL